VTRQVRRISADTPPEPTITRCCVGWSSGSSATATPSRSRDTRRVPRLVCRDCLRSRMHFEEHGLAHRSRTLVRVLLKHDGHSASSCVNQLAAALAADWLRDGMGLNIPRSSRFRGDALASVRVLANTEWIAVRVPGGPGFAEPKVPALTVNPVAPQRLDGLGDRSSDRPQQN